MVAEPSPITTALANMLNSIANPIFIGILLILVVLGTIFPRNSPFQDRYLVQVIGAPIFGLWELLKRAGFKLLLTLILIVAVTAIIAAVVLVIFGFIIGLVTDGDVLSGWYQLIDLWDYIRGGV